MLDIFEKCGKNEIETTEYSIKFRNCRMFPNMIKCYIQLIMKTIFLKTL